MPMSLWLWPMPDDPGLAAIMYGPLVLAGRLGDGDYVFDRTFLRGQREQHHAPNVTPPVLVVEPGADPSDWLEPISGEPLTFRTAGVGRPHDVTLVSFHELFDERYTIYWRITDEAGWRKIEADREARETAEAEAARREAERQAAYLARMIDAVELGDSASEEAHAMRGEGTHSGTHLGRPWRDAVGGWFEYRLRVSLDGPTTLLCTYWGSDVARVFDVLVDGQKLATQELARNVPNEFFDVEYPIPPGLTEGKDLVVVRFVAHPGSTAGGVFGCATLGPAD
jgi:hypothetical protein